MKNNFIIILFSLILFSNSSLAQSYCFTITETSATYPSVTYSWTLTATQPISASIRILGTGSLLGKNKTVGGSGTSLSDVFTLTRTSTDPYGYTVNTASPYGVILQSNSADVPASCVVLPVQLTTFTATPLSKIVKLDWSTASEKNSSHYEIERSKEGKVFENIGSLKAMGNSVSKSNYTFMDEKPQFGINYYRLKMMNIEGTYEYSTIKTAIIQGEKTLVTVFPNPTSDETYVNILSPNETTASIKLYNGQGQNLKIVLPKLNIGDNTLPLELTDLPSGTYFIFVEANNQSFSMKVSKNW